MEIIRCKELAFFNMLGRLVTLNTDKTEQNITLSYSDLEKKMELDKKIISAFLKKLKNGRVIDIVKDDATTISINFNKTYENIFELVQPSELDTILIEINEFVFKYIRFFNFSQTYPTVIETAKKIKEMMEKDPNVNLHPYIKDGIQIQYNHPAVAFYYSKFFFELAEKIDVEDQKILENIIYYFFNLPYHENPFVATVFLAQIIFQIEALKNEIKWENIFKI